MKKQLPGQPVREIQVPARMHETGPLPCLYTALKYPAPNTDRADILSNPRSVVKTCGTNQPTLRKGALT
jgi:hypothetical protein